MQAAVNSGTRGSELQKKLLLGLFLLLQFHLWAQQESIKKNGAEISGKVIDALSKKPIEYATITLFKPANKKALTGTTTNSTGGFT